jgi:hypothetical protein
LMLGIEIHVRHPNRALSVCKKPSIKYLLTGLAPIKASITRV